MTGDTLEADDIVNPDTNELEKGYYLKDNCVVKIFNTNTNALSTPIEIKNYYYREIDGYNIKLLNSENVINSGSEYQIIPNHTYTQLKNTGRLNNKLFTIECTYDIKENGEVVNKKERLFFMLLGDDEYKNKDTAIKNRKSGIINKKID